MDKYSTKRVRIIRIVRDAFLRKIELGQVGPKWQVTNQQMCDGIQKMHRIKVSSEYMRGIIHDVRTLGLVPDLCATRKGYYVAASGNETFLYLRDSLYPRIMSQLYMLSRVRKHSRFQGLLELDLDFQSLERQWDLQESLIKSQNKL